MRKILGWLSFAVAALVVIVVAVSNRHAVEFYFWPGGQGVQLRLFALVLFTAFAAYLLGRASGLWRARQARSQLRQLEYTLRSVEREKLALQQERDSLKATVAPVPVPAADKPALPTMPLAAVSSSREVA